MRTITPLSAFLLLVVLTAGAVAQARVVNRDRLWQQRCDSIDIPYPPPGIALVAYKQQKLLEIWARGRDGAHVLLATYPICQASGELGPKRMQGDGQVPEGMYQIVRFNPVSTFHLSLGINYPNAGDRKQSAEVPPGGDIYIHGNCVSAGCLAMTDPGIEEIYWLAHRLRRTRIPVLVFPTNDAAGWARLGSDSTAANSATRHRFWSSLKPLHEAWITSRRIPSFTFDADGLYVLRDVVKRGTSTSGSASP